jgi:hypothetical protein
LRPRTRTKVKYHSTPGRNQSFLRRIYRFFTPREIGDTRPSAPGVWSPLAAGENPFHSWKGEIMARFESRLRFKEIERYIFILIIFNLKYY